MTTFTAETQRTQSERGWGATLRRRGGLAVQMARQQWREATAAEVAAGDVARAFAVGTFIGLLPLPGLDFALAFIVLRLFKRLERAPLLAALAVWNNLVSAPIYASGYRVGTAVMTAVPISLALEESYPALVWAQSFFVGNVIMTVAASVASYFAVHLGLDRYRAAVASPTPGP